MDWSRLDHVPTVATAMTPFPHAVEAAAPALAALALMDEHGIRHVPVKDGGQLVGVVTRSGLAGLTRAQLEVQRVREVGVFEPHVVDVVTPLDVVAREMSEHHAACALVLKDGRLAGIFTATDACRVLSELLSTAFRRPGPGSAA